MQAEVEEVQLEGVEQQGPPVGVAGVAEEAEVATLQAGHQQQLVIPVGRPG